MQDHIENLVNGIFEYENAKLSLSEKKLELSVEALNPASGRFVITSNRERRIRGRIYTSTPRMRCGIVEFDDFEVEVPYQFDSTGMEEGDVLKGEITVISDAGETILPFVVSIIHSVIQSSVGNIKNLFHFTNLAQADFNEAVKIFYSPEFKKIFVNNDRSFYNIYRGLCAVRNSAANVEEFLISIHKKHPIRYFASEEAEIDADEESAYEIAVTKNGWGFVSVQVETDCSFLRLEKEALTDDDFLGNRCSFFCMIEKQKLHAGKNYGNVFLRTPHQTVKIALTVRKKDAPGGSREKRLLYQRLNFELTQTYISFRLKKINVSAWAEKSMRLVQKIITMDDKDLPARLFQAQLLFSQNRPNEAKWILDHVNGEFEMKEKPAELYGYYLYLRAMDAGDGIYAEEMAEEVYKLYVRHRNSGRLLWILLYLDERLASSPEKKLYMLEDQYDMGNRSPVLYIEGYRMFSADPLLMTKLTAYEIQIIYWAVKHGLCQEDIAAQVVYLAGKTKHFEPVLHKILSAFYRAFPKDEVLAATCAHLMRGSRTGEEDFPWYEKAVERGIRLTRLFEYYMLSVPLARKDELPRVIQMYFAYDCNLDYRRTAWLYENLIRHGDKNPEILRSYEMQMERFAVRQVQQCHIDENLAVVYEFMMRKDVVREAFQENYSGFIFKHQLKMREGFRKFRFAAVVQEALKEEERVPIIDGRAQFEIYGKEYEIFLEDDAGNRYHEELPCEVAALFQISRYTEIMRQAQEIPIGVSIYMSEGRRHYIIIEEKNDRFARKVAESPLIREDYKREIRQSLLQYYYDHERVEELNIFLEGVDLEELYARERAEIAELLIRLGRYREACAIVSKYGTENIHSKYLVKLASRMVSDSEDEVDETILNMAHSAFRAGKYDMTVLTYLTKVYQGTTKELRNIWKAAVNFEVDTHDLEERLLVQMLYTGSFVGEKQDIFSSYVRGGACTPIVLAYLSYNAYEYFIRDSLMEDRFFEMLLCEYERGETLNDMCRLALILYFAEGMGRSVPSAMYTKDRAEMTAQFIRDFLRREIVFGFFSAFAEEVEELAFYADRVFVEYKALPGSRVVIHYIVESGSNEEVNYRKEEMHHMFGGIFSRQFILFYGDTLQYYITEEVRGKEQLTRSSMIDRDDIHMGGRETRYDVLNDMLIGRALQDDVSLVDLMEVYRKKEKAVSALFCIK